MQANTFVGSYMGMRRGKGKTKKITCRFSVGEEITAYVLRQTRRKWGWKWMH